MLWGTSWILPPFSATLELILLHPDLPMGSAKALILTHCRVTVLFQIPLPSFLQRCDHVFPNGTHHANLSHSICVPRETELRHYGTPTIPRSPQLAMSPHPGPPGRIETTFVNSSTHPVIPQVWTSLSHTHTHIHTQPHSMGSSRGLFLLPQPSWRFGQAPPHFPPFFYLSMRGWTRGLNSRDQGHEHLKSCTQAENPRTLGTQYRAQGAGCPGKTCQQTGTSERFIGPWDLVGLSSVKN